MYSKPNVSMVAAVARNMSHSANVTIYGMVCSVSDYCDVEYETIDELVVHLVNDHEEMWSEGCFLKDLQIDGHLLEEVKNCEMIIEEGKYLKCKCCEKYYDSLDSLLYHILNDHGGIFKGNKFRIGAEFLLDNGYVFDDYESEDEPSEEMSEHILEVRHEKLQRNGSVNKFWEVIESDDEFEYYGEETIDYEEEMEGRAESSIEDPASVGEKDVVEMVLSGNKEDSNKDLAAEESVEKSQVRKEEFECDQCHVRFDSDSDLEAHMIRYHQVVNKCRFCPFEANLADLLEHLGRNCDEVTDEAREPDEESWNGGGEVELHETLREGGDTERKDEEELVEENDTDYEAFNLIQLKCDVCDFAEVRAYSDIEHKVPKHVHIWENCEEVVLDDDFQVINSKDDELVPVLPETQDVPSPSKEVESLQTQDVEYRNDLNPVDSQGDESIGKVDVESLIQDVEEVDTQDACGVELLAQDVEPINTHAVDAPDVRPAVAYDAIDMAAEVQNDQALVLEQDVFVDAKKNNSDAAQVVKQDQEYALVVEQDDEAQDGAEEVTRLDRSVEFDRTIDINSAAHSKVDENVKSDVNSSKVQVVKFQRKKEEDNEICVSEPVQVEHVSSGFEMCRLKVSKGFSALSEIVNNHIDKIIGVVKTRFDEQKSGENSCVTNVSDADLVDNKKSKLKPQETSDSLYSSDDALTKDNVKASTIHMESEGVAAGADKHKVDELDEPDDKKSDEMSDNGTKRRKAGVIVGETEVQESDDQLERFTDTGACQGMKTMYTGKVKWIDTKMLGSTERSILECTKDAKVIDSMETLHWNDKVIDTKHESLAEKYLENMEEDLSPLYSPQELIKLIRNDLGIFDVAEGENGKDEEKQKQANNKRMRTNPSKTSDIKDVVSMLEGLIEDMEEMMKEKIVEVRRDKVIEERRVGTYGTAILSERRSEEVLNVTKGILEEDGKVSIETDLFEVDEETLEIKELGSEQEESELGLNVLGVDMFVNVDEVEGPAKSKENKEVLEDDEVTVNNKVSEENDETPEVEVKVDEEMMKSLNLLTQLVYDDWNTLTIKVKEMYEKVLSLVRPRNEKPLLDGESFTADLGRRMAENKRTKKRKYNECLEFDVHLVTNLLLMT